MRAPPRHANRRGGHPDNPRIAPTRGCTLNRAMSTDTSRQQSGGGDALSFLRQWLRNPGGIGSVTPSGTALAAAMAAELPAGASAGRVVELGPGTGCVTQALLAAGVDPARLVAVETNAAFCALLRGRYPAIRIVEGDACELEQLLDDAGAVPVAAVVSSLPLLSLGDSRRRAVLAQVARVLAPGGVLVQYTYGLMPPVPRAPAAGLGLAGRRVAWVPLNLPPAWVWRYRRAAAVPGPPFVT